MTWPHNQMKPCDASPKAKTAGVCALITVGLYVSGLLVILTPLPLIYVSATAGRKNGILASAISIVLIAVLYIGVAVFVEPAGRSYTFPIPLPGLGLMPAFSFLAVEIMGGGYFLFFITIALTLGEAIRCHLGLVRGGVLALSSALLLSLLVAAALHFSGTMHLVAGVKGYIEFMVAEIVRIQSSSGVTNAQTAILTEHGPEVVSFVLNVMPSLVFVFAVIAVVVNLLLLKRFIRLPHLFSGHAWDVAAFRIPDALVWVVILSAFLSLAGKYLGVRTGFIGINVLIAFAVIYFFQGLAVTAFFLRRVKSPLLRILSYVLIAVFFQTIGVLIVGVGISDVWVDFRRRFRAVSGQ